MPASYKSYELRPPKGGRLVGGISEDTGAEGNYTRKVNFRRDLDVEMRREGWELFNPKFDRDPLDMPLYEDDDVTMLFQFARPNGNTALLAAAGDRLYRLFSTNDLPEYTDADYLYPNSGGHDSYYTGGDFSFNWKVIADGITIPGSIVEIKVLSEGEQFSSHAAPVVTVKGDGEGAELIADVAEAEYSLPQGSHAPYIHGEYVGKIRRGYTIKVKGTTFTAWRGVDDKKTTIIDNQPISSQHIPLDYGMFISFPIGNYSETEQFTFLAKPRRVETIRVISKGKGYTEPPEIVVEDEGGRGTGVIATAVINPHNRWESISLNGYAVVNNGIELPFVYREEWDKATPLHALRELGVVRVGCITEYAGSLLCGDIVELTEESLAKWADACATDNLDPYGVITDEHIEKYELDVDETQYAVMWSFAGNPLQWGVSVKGSMTGGDKFWYPRHPNMVKSFQPGQDFYVTGAATLGELLTTKIENIWEEGDKVTMFELADPSNAGDGISNTDGTAGADGLPDGTVTDAVSYSSLSGGDSVELLGDGSRIVKMMKLTDKLVIYRETGYWMGSITSSVEDPFAFTERYRGQRYAAFRNTVTNISDKYHMFMGYQGVFKIDLTEAEPSWVPAFQVGPEVWRTLKMSDAERVFTYNNSLTSEIWLCLPKRFDDPTFCFDYRTSTLSTIDQHFTAGLVIRRPQNTMVEQSDDMCVITYDGIIYTYGYEIAGRKGIYNRVFADYTSVLGSSLMNFSGRFNEKDLRSYVLLLDQADPTIGLKMQIYTQGSPLDEPVLAAEHSIKDLDDETMVPLWVRSLFFKDTITVEGSNNPMRLTSRLYELSNVESRSQTQSTGEGTSAS